MTTEADKEPEKSPVIARLLRNKACHKMPSRVRVNKEGSARLSTHLHVGGGQELQQLVLGILAAQ